jgi:hypothetical protein
MSNEDRLRVLQSLIKRAQTIPSPYPNFKAVRPLVIGMEQILCDQYPEKDERRDIRLGILSIIVGRGIGTTYDLRVAELRTILGQLFSNRDDENATGTEQFLEHMAQLYKSQGFHRPSRDSNISWGNGDATSVSDLHEAPF